MTTNTTPIDRSDIVPEPTYERDARQAFADLAADGWALTTEVVALAAAREARPRTRGMESYEAGSLTVDLDLDVQLVPVTGGRFQTTGYLISIEGEYLIASPAWAGFDAAKRPGPRVFSIFETQHDAANVARSIVAEIAR